MPKSRKLCMQDILSINAQNAMKRSQYRFCRTNTLNAKLFLVVTHPECSAGNQMAVIEKLETIRKVVCCIRSV